MSDILVELLGIIAGTLGVIAWVPQLNEVWKQKKHEGISLPTLYLICTALLLWLVYGFIIGSIAIILSNLAALYCILIIIFGVNKLRKTDAYLFFTKIWVSLIQK
jgi:MtN3 and saliva related transmembrane protein